MSGQSPSACRGGRAASSSCSCARPGLFGRARRAHSDCSSACVFCVRRATYCFARLTCDRNTVLSLAISASSKCTLSPLASRRSTESSASEAIRTVARRSHGNIKINLEQLAEVAVHTETDIVLADKVGRGLGPDHNQHRNSDHNRRDTAARRPPHIRGLGLGQQGKKPTFGKASNSRSYP